LGRPLHKWQVQKGVKKRQPKKCFSPLVASVNWSIWGIPEHMRGILYILVGVLFCILFTHLCDRLLVWDGVVWGGCSWVYGAYRLGWDVVKWPGEKKREGCAVAVAEGSGHQCLTILCFNFWNVLRR